VDVQTWHMVQSHWCMCSNDRGLQYSLPVVIPAPRNRRWIAGNLWAIRPDRQLTAAVCINLQSQQQKQSVDRYQGDCSLPHSLPPPLTPFSNLPIPNRCQRCTEINSIFHSSSCQTPTKVLTVNRPPWYIRWNELPGWGLYTSTVSDKAIRLMLNSMPTFPFSVLDQQARATGCWQVASRYRIFHSISHCKCHHTLLQL